MPIELSIDKVVSTTSLNVTSTFSDPKVDYFTGSVFLQSYLSLPSLTFSPFVPPLKLNFSNYLNYVDYANLYLEIPPSDYQGFPNLLNRISIRIPPTAFTLPSVYSFVSSSKTLFVKPKVFIYPYSPGYSYVYFSSENNINYLNEVDDLILAWNSSNNKVFQHFPREAPPELPSNPGGGTSGLKEFWA